MNALAEAIAVAAKAEAAHQIGRWAGIPSRLAHRQTDRWLGVVQAVEDELRPNVVLRWR